MANSAKDRLICFMAEMNEWETEFCAAQDAADEEDLDIIPIKEDYKKKLEAILDEYSLSHGSNRDRLIDLGATVPATYQPTDDHIEADPTDAIFMVQQSNGFRSKFRFFMVERDGTWFIDRKERAEGKDKWVRSSL
ncbi:NTF2 fold immunity protein [Pseudomonas sp. CFBP 8772]|uniref:NTF2 fold immunity protein n=1 Tax=Pseudomonas sp. CFBP 8772 TaxID=2775284 RepID=UPI00178359D6|nr:NTF2 fold immunity protein [Pseudomonas sp. CFBP 8772]MBD8596566.1 hypothetical protein [Pseudomonas sp. CFBP 8772]